MWLDIPFLSIFHSSFGFIFALYAVSSPLDIFVFTSASCSNLPEGVSVQNASSSPLLSPKPLMTASTSSSPLMLLYGLETNILSISAGSPRTCSRIKPEYNDDPQVLRSIERDLRSNTARV
jgi:hypothetical protein